MRFAILLLALGGSTAVAQSKQKIAILGLEVSSSGAPDPQTVRVAQDFTVALRSRPKAGVGPYAYAPNTERDLVEEKLLANCESEAASCMAAIGASFAADVLMYGKLEVVGTNYRVTVRLLDVAKKKVVAGWGDLIPVADASAPKLQNYANKGYKGITEGGVTANAPSSPPTSKAPPPPPPPAKGNCNYEETVTKGDQQMSAGNYAAAIVQYEQALKCKADTALYPKLFLASCRARFEPKAKFYYKKMSAKQQATYAQVCVRLAPDPRIP